jgi:hypothetical protein
LNARAAIGDVPDDATVPEDIERRLAEAAGRLREHDLTVARTAAVRQRLQSMDAELAALRETHAREQRDVDRLEGLSLARIVASLRGSREDAIERERAEAEAARYRVADAEARLAAVRREEEAARARLSGLAAAPAEYAAALGEKERYLGSSGDPRGARLLALAEERGRLTGEAREAAEALAAARTAWEALSRVQDSLGRAAGWSTYDTFFGGGAVSSSIKHSRLDDAAKEAAYADRCLLALRTELADVGGVAQTGPALAMDGLTRFVDVWFDNFFTDMAVRGRIKRAQENVDRCMRRVQQVTAALEQRTVDIRARLAAIEAERLAVLVD